MKRLLAIVLIGGSIQVSPLYGGELSWPSTFPHTKPWTRWWWQGNAVSEEGIKRHLDEFARIGIGGVEITSIYGVKGMEDSFIPYLSEEYMRVLRVTADYAQHHHMGVDIPPGSGWRCGGPWMTLDDADAQVVIEEQEVKSGEVVSLAFEDSPQALMAFSASGDKIDLLSLINQQKEWKVPQGQWILYTVTQKWSGARVKRPSIGGEGYSFNPYSRRSTAVMLEPFTAAFDVFPDSLVGDLFHDSFEYSGDWCDTFFDEFEQRRGYRLQDVLPQFSGNGDPEIVKRVKCDYRETLSDLVLDNFLLPLKQWANNKGWNLRNQSHGSPANLLDLYAAVDVPETEIFRFDHDRRVLKFASSPAHILGKSLVSSESYTWQDEHFTVTLDTLKRSTDLLFSCGINHIFFHGTTYSPESADWPGWVFYASTQINPQNPWWEDLAALNEYITRCQSMLQTAEPDNDVLVYWPVYDYWSDEEGLRKSCTVHHNDWISQNGAGYVAEKLQDAGVSYDFISDHLLTLASVNNSSIVLPGADYQALILPDCEYIPIETMNTVLKLAEAGARIFLESIPQNVPGLHNRQIRQKVLGEMLRSISPDSSGVCRYGEGLFIYPQDLISTLATQDVPGEPCAAFDLQWLRKKHDQGHLYFFANVGGDFDDYLPLKGDFHSAAIYDPLTGDIGLAEMRTSGDHAVRLQLDAGKSCFVKTFRKTVRGEPRPYFQLSDQSLPLTGEWQVTFTRGGPVLPDAYVTDRLESWTDNGDAETRRFSGTAHYQLRFDAPGTNQRFYILDLGAVAHSVRIVLNDQELATLFARPFRLPVQLKDHDNQLELYVTNLAANRIRDLDRRGVEWRIFHDINFVNIEYQPFDASNWEVRESGLLGPVTLTPVHLQGKKK